MNNKQSNQMKKSCSLYISGTLILLSSILFLLGCSGLGTPELDPPNISETHMVRFYANGGIGAPTPIKVIVETPLIEPTDQPSRTGYSFGGWYTTSIENEQDGSTKYKFGRSLSGELDLYARWYTGQPADQEDLINLLNAATPTSDLNLIDVSGVGEMGGLILKLANPASFNHDISRWDTSEVIGMASMLEGATAFNQDISKWDTSKVSNMGSMFKGAVAFNQDISGWDTSSAISMRSMFEDATAFNQDIGGWKTQTVNSMDNMFRDAVAFNQDLRSWSNRDHTGTGIPTNMFDGASSMDPGNKATWMP